MARAYRLGKRQAAVDRTAAAVLDAARELVAESGRGFAIGALARRAGVSRATVYNRFRSRTAIFDALRPPRPFEPGGAPDLRSYFDRSCAAWAAEPALYRHLDDAGPGDDGPRRIAASLAAADRLRPGCSLKEAEDVIGLLTSFAVFDRLHRDGRRSAAAVADVLSRLAAGILA